MPRLHGRDFARAVGSVVVGDERVGSWVGSLIGAFVLCVGALAVTPGAATAQVVVPPDVAAMSLTPVDLESAGLPGHGWSNGILTSRPQTLAEFFTVWRSETDVAAIGSALSASAPSRVYALHLVRPTTEGDPSRVEERVVSYVISFDDEESAAAGFSTWAAAWRAGYASASTSVAVGDERFVVAGEATESDGSPFPLVHMAFRTGTLLAGVSVEFFTGFAPEQATVEALAARQEERIDSVLADGGPGLSSRMVYFDVPGTQSITAVYGIRDGQRVFRDSDTVSSAAESQATATAAGIVDQFQIEQQLGGEAGGSEAPLAFYTSRIVTFAASDAASAYIADSVARLTEGGSTNLTPVAAPTAAGEEVSAYTYTHQRDDGVQFNDYRIYARTGSTVFSIAINSTGQVDRAAMDAVAALQASCLAETASCAAGFAVPPSLVP